MTGPRVRATYRRVVAPVAPDPEPLFRWTFETWIRREWKNASYSPQSDDVLARTVTVTAPTEDEAKRKIIAALPDPPAPRDAYNINQETRDRMWTIKADVVEVER